MRLEKVLTNFRLAKCRLTVTSKVCFYVVCLKIENDFKAEHDEDFQELNNFWYIPINFGFKENLLENFEAFLVRILLIFLKNSGYLLFLNENLNIESFEGNFGMTILTI